MYGAEILERKDASSYRHSAGFYDDFIISY